MSRLRRTRGLRASVLIAFGAGALLISLLMAASTYLAARHYIVEQRERSAVRQAFNGAGLVQAALQDPDRDVETVLEGLNISSRTTVYLRLDGTWHTVGPAPTGPDITDGVARAVADGDVALSWSSQTRPPSLVVGTPLPGIEAEYYEATPTEELATTLGTLRTTLAISAGGTTLAGVALGWFATRRMLHPLHQVADAASRIAEGDLDTRLEDNEDPDLAGLVRSFNTMVDAVAERIQADARFAANVSHELRTPVSTLTTSLGVVQRDPELSERSATAVGLMAAEVARLRQALEDLIALERLDARVPDADADAEVVPVGDLVAHALRENQVDTSLVEILDEVAVRVDQPQIRRALSNLVRNAQTHGGGLHSVEVRRVGDEVEIHVRDRGPGIAAQDTARVFERFTRLGARGSGGGSGLGLSIVEGTALAHGGSVRYVDHHPRGADFVLTLPLSETQEPE
ncbi:HAMP domain-containing histidine kinase [Nocardioides sp. zg-ZUI104]|uniref:sensor histidine kinase n=1 Tax=Nocardioides faecalis TaxID=2803858 RepID=UPI001BCE7996|nr:HAMP domain-containing sensor histidine kinase [Nocardioides faecalis]MBS4751632.1 HAMP domain-containing histidine kinase [Nocardioides faecalis]